VRYPIASATKRRATPGAALLFVQNKKELPRRSSFLVDLMGIEPISEKPFQDSFFQAHLHLRGLHLFRARNATNTETDDDAQGSHVQSGMSAQASQGVYDTRMLRSDSIAFVGGGVITRRPEQRKACGAQKRRLPSPLKIRLHVLSEACDNAERFVRGLRVVGCVSRRKPSRPLKICYPSLSIFFVASCV
jgi:hypothetical protein